MGISPAAYFLDLRNRCKQECKCCTTNNEPGRKQVESDEDQQSIMQDVDTSNRQTTDSEGETAPVNTQKSVEVQLASNGHSASYKAHQETNKD